MGVGAGEGSSHGLVVGSCIWEHVGWGRVSDRRELRLSSGEGPTSRVAVKRQVSCRLREGGGERSAGTTPQAGRVDLARLSTPPGAMQACAGGLGVHATADAPRPGDEARPSRHSARPCGSRALKEALWCSCGRRVSGQAGHTFAPAAEASRAICSCGQMTYASASACTKAAWQQAGTRHSQNESYDSIVAVWAGQGTSAPAPRRRHQNRARVRGGVWATCAEPLNRESG
eukprot:scaffold34994_cov146-Isochrysis_galbana.AAC.1